MVSLRQHVNYQLNQQQEVFINYYSIAEGIWKSLSEGVTREKESNERMW
jgi:hypothetical protein